MFDRSGVFTAMFGVTMLILLAVSLSLVMEKRAAFTKSKIGLELSIETNKEVIVGMKENLAELGAKWDRERHRNRNHGKTIAEKRVLETVDRRRLSELTARKAVLGEAIGMADAKFKMYRSDYRKATWAGAIGEKWPVLRARGGREYLEAVILKVTEIGLEIRHPHGIARIQAGDLGSEWQDRFQWPAPGDSLGRN